MIFIIKRDIELNLEIKIFMKGYQVFSFVKNMGKKTGQIIRKILNIKNGKYSQNFLIMLKNWLLRVQLM